MDNVVRKIILNIILVYIISIVFFFVFSVVSSHVVYVGADYNGLSDPSSYGYSLLLKESKGFAASFTSNPPVLAVYRVRWILANTMILFIRYFTAIHLTAILLSYSLIFPYKYGPDGIQSSFLNIVGKNIIVFLVFTLLFTGLKEAGYPPIRKKIQEYNSYSKISVDLFEKANSAFKNGNYQKAGRYFSSYLEIDKGNDVVKNIQKWTLAKLEIREKKPTFPKRDSPGNEEHLTNYKKAENFFNEKNYFSAYYYAFISSEAEDVSLHKEAMKLMAKAENNMKILISKSSDIKARNLFERKMEALNSLKTENYFDAYTEFKSLSSEFPMDKDISEFLNICENKIREHAFFSDEVEQYRFFPGIDNIVYTVNESLGVLDFIKIKKYVNTDEGEYFFGIEVLKIYPEGDIKTHFTVSYGKLSKDGYIMLQSIDRVTGTIFKPKVLPGETKVVDLPGEKVPFNTENFVFFKGGNKGFDDASMLYLYKMQEIRAKYGYYSIPVTSALLNRMLMPFSFFILSLFAVHVGWVFRIGKRALPWLALPFIAMIPLILNRFLILWSYAYKILISFLLFKTGTAAALAVLITLQGILIFIGLFNLALAREERLS